MIPRLQPPAGSGGVVRLHTINERGQKNKLKVCELNSPLIDPPKGKGEHYVIEAKKQNKFGCRSRNFALVNHNVINDVLHILVRACFYCQVWSSLANKKVAELSAVKQSQCEGKTNKIVLLQDPSFCLDPLPSLHCIHPPSISP